MYNKELSLWSMDSKLGIKHISQFRLAVQLFQRLSEKEMLNINTG